MRLEKGILSTVKYNFDCWLVISIIPESYNPIRQLEDTHSPFTKTDTHHYLLHSYHTFRKSEIHLPTNRKTNINLLLAGLFYYLMKLGLDPQGIKRTKQMQERRPLTDVGVN